MHYRTLGKTGERVSILGFGAMRLPILDRDSTRIDEEHATRMIRHAVDRGVNYVDTAFPYHGDNMTRPGASEPLVGRALRDGYRERVHLATKLPCWVVQSREHMDEILAGQLERLETDRIEFYLVHAVNRKTWPRMLELGVFDFLEKARRDGRIRHVGFSYHDNPGFFREVVDAHDWGFCQIQYNYLDEDFQAGRAGLEYAADKQLGVIVMEPLRGGWLVSDLPEEVRAALAESREPKTPVQWALRWLWNHEQVGTVLSGMSTFEQVEENVAAAAEQGATSLSEEDLAIVERVQGIFRKNQRVDCTACRYCLPCPQGVDIPENFTLYNKLHLTGDARSSSMMYGMVLSPEEKASNCIECGHCEEHCPQGIAIAEELEKVAATFEEPEEAGAEA